MAPIHLINKTAKDKIPGGLADEKSPKDFSPIHLAKGKKVELEHTDNPGIATEIAMDHLTEDPDYYEKLEKVEKDVPEHLKKGQELVSQPREHQRQLINILQEQPGLVAAHGVGTGKTLSSIAAAHQLGLPIEAIVPASLQENYLKELKKHIKGKYPARVRSYEKATQEKSIDPASLMVLDEAHRARNPGTRTQTLHELAPYVQKRLALTGTPVFNKPSDIASLVNFAAGEEVLPGNDKLFSDKFIGNIKVGPGFIATLRGAKAADVPYLKEHPKLREALKKWTHYHDAGESEDFPEREDIDVHVPMGKGQQQIYQTILNKAPFWVRHKVRRGLPPSKQEAKQLNAFLSGARQISNTPHGFMQNMTPDAERENSPKINAILHHVRTSLQKDPEHRAVIYSNYKDSGVLPMARRLEEAGIPHAVFSGGLKPEERKKIVENFNKGKAPVLLITSAGSEGLDLKGVRSMHVMEPHFNKEKLEQVIGRARRYKSHEHLPKDKRHVQVRYYQARPKSSLLAQKLLGRSKLMPGVDDYLMELAAYKGALNDQLLNMMKETTKERQKEKSAPLHLDESPSRHSGFAPATSAA